MDWAWLVLSFFVGFVAGGILGMPFVITTGEAKSLIKKWEAKYGTQDGKSILDDQS